MPCQSLFVDTGASHISVRNDNSSPAEGIEQLIHSTIGEIQIISIVEIRSSMDSSHDDRLNIVGYEPVAELRFYNFKAASFDVRRQHIFQIHTPSLSIR